MSSLGLIKRTGIYWHEDTLLHQTTHHVESPERVTSIIDDLKRFGLYSYCQEFQPKEIKTQDLKFTHSEKHIQKITNLQSSGWFDGDTYFNEHSSRASCGCIQSLLAAGSVLELMENVVSDKLDNGFAIIRPPGHHCEYEKAMGFCLLNNVAIATNVIRAKYQSRICIIDWDVHHGNGTQNSFYNDGDVLYISIHRFDNGSFYPGTGLIDEVGSDGEDDENDGNEEDDKDDDNKKDKENNVNINVNVAIQDDKTKRDKKKKKKESAKGKTLNIPLTRGMGDYEYNLIFNDILIPVVQSFKPDIILVSAGFDACIGDPLGGMNVTPPMYGIMTNKLLKVCSKVCLVLEGGYNVVTMPKAVCYCVYSLLKQINSNDNSNDGVNTDNSEEIENEIKIKYEKQFLEDIKDAKEFQAWKLYEDKVIIVKYEKKINKIISDVLKAQIDYWPILKNSFKKYHKVNENIEENKNSDVDNLGKLLSNMEIKK